FETLHLVSAEHDHGITDLMDEVYTLLGPGPEDEEDDEDDDSGALPDEEYDEDADAEGLDDDEDLDDDDSEDDDSADPDDADADLDDDEDLDDEEWSPELDEAEAPAPSGKGRVAPEPEEIRIAVLGRPNVGKSTLVNRLLGEERQVVSDKPGTTMDAIDLPLEVGGRKFVLVDTAGIRRKARIETDLEGFAISRSLRAIERCHVVLMVLDGEEGVSEQDARLLQVVLHRGRAVILLVNKWDLVRDDPERDVTVLEKELAHRMPHAPWAPVLYISARSGKGVSRVLPMVEEVFKAFNQRLTTAECNRFLRAAVLAHSVPQRHHRPVRINYMTQIRVRPPTFVLWCNVPEGVDEAYKRYLSNRLREAYGFKGTSLRLFFRRKRRPGEALPGEHMV
ncbi:ribosome biogenesis GTPase Der, partial [Myxococcota bacterium]|nr:ribosome biogenesis GTPase Der [Myxococcota bacterium]